MTGYVRALYQGTRVYIQGKQGIYFQVISEAGILAGKIPILIPCGSITLDNSPKV